MVALQDIEEPDPDETIWRYMDLSKLISVFETTELYFNLGKSEYRRPAEYRNPFDFKWQEP